MRVGKSGFTLIEVMLSLAIFTVIGLATVRHIQQIQNTKQASFEELDLYNGVRAALSMMRYDLNQAFHVLYDDLGTLNKQALLRNQKIPHSLFDGRKSELVFTSLSHRNFYPERRESEQTEISYFLHNREGQRLPTLMKRESEIIDEDPFQGGRIYALLDGIQQLLFQYWNPRTLKWEDEWNSDGSTFRDQFPPSLKLKLSAINPQGRPLAVETQFKISFPNNTPLVVQF